MKIVTIYLIDTSYLLELFKVPGCYSERSSTVIKELFKKGIENGSRFVVPYPCIFELANHIAHVANGYERSTLAAKVYNTVKSSLTDQSPWIIPPNKNIDEVLIEICRIFAETYVSDSIGLTDTYLISEANAWKSKYNGAHYKVHIWTTDGCLKAYEPDAEAKAFV